MGAQCGRGSECLVRLNSLGEDLDPSRGLPGTLGMENAPACPCQAFQPHCASRMPPLGPPVLDSALPSAPAPPPILLGWGWGAREGKQAVMINSTDTLTFFPN